MVGLNEQVRMVIAQFSLSNPSIILEGIKRYGLEMREYQEKRKIRSTGTMVIGPIKNCSGEGLLEQLENAGYEIVKAFSRERADSKDARSIQIVRFEFVRSGYITHSPNLDYFRTGLKKIRTTFAEMLETAMWRIRVFNNPFYSGHKELVDYRSVSINFDCRRSKNKSISNIPIEFRPDNYICVSNNTIQVVKA